MSRLIDFYRGVATDVAGRTLEEILQYTDGEMESIHDFIQWTFPLQEASRFNPNAPLLSDSDVATFRADGALQDGLLAALDRFLTFLGLERNTDEIVPASNYPSRSEILKTPNHNWLRITRVLHCLRLLGQEEAGRRLFLCLEKLQSEGRAAVASDTLRYWRDATYSR